jgi:deazaflavin-dependent oxidoreductase (nitroreductase family)
MAEAGRIPRGRPRRNIVAGDPPPRRAKVLEAILRPWFAHGPHSGVAVLTTIGRRTGKPRRHCVRAIRRGDRVYLVSISGTHSSWFTNLRANPRVRLRIQRTNLEGTAREPRDAEERALAKDVYVGSVNASDYVECFLHWSGLPNRKKIQRVHEMWFEGGVPLVIELLPQQAPDTRALARERV